MVPIFALPRKRIPNHKTNRPDRMTYTDEYEEKIENATERMKNGMLGFQDAMEAISEVVMLQDSYIEELERTASCDRVRLHVTMFMVCVLCYIYGTYFGLYLGRK
jgi:hypothetical protein